MPSHTEAERLKSAREVLEQGNVVGQAAEKFAASQGIKAPFTPTTFTEQPTTAPSVVPSPAITGEDLTQKPDLGFKKPQFVSTIRSEDLEPSKLKSTQRETEQTDLEKRIQEINRRLSEETAFRLGEETRLGVPEFETGLEDFSRRLRDIQRQMQAVEISPEFERRNVLTPFAEGERARAKRDLAVEGLTISGLIDAQQGLVTSANRKLERAVAEKFGALKAEKEALLENLKIIKESPETSRQDKERAEKQTKIAEAEKKEIEKKEKQAEEIIKTAAKVAETGKATTLQIEEIRKLLDNPTPENQIRASQLAAPFLKKEKKLPADIDTFKAFFPNVDITTPAGRQQFLTFQAQKAAAGRKPGEPSALADEDIDSLARRLNAGTIKLSNIPEKIRAKISGRAKELAVIDLQEDIEAGLQENITKEELLKRIKPAYPEFSQNELNSQIDKAFTRSTTVTSAKERGGLFGAIGGFFNRLFGR